jgi:predicted O-methyltransferase YrrM
LRLKFEQAHQFLTGIPYIRPRAARRLYQFVLDAGVADILELGFAHGTSTCYMAAALDERGAGSIVTIDRPQARDLEPSLETLLERMGLWRFVRPIYADVSYTWELMKIIQSSTVAGICHPQFDFGFIDGAHTWETDGLAFFLADKLLRTGGWLLFDDLVWRMSDDPRMLAHSSVRALPREVRDTPQVARIFELLVCQHPSYSQVKVEEAWSRTWGWARKTGSLPAASPSTEVHGRLRRLQLRRDALLVGWKSARSIFRRR